MHNEQLPSVIQSHLLNIIESVPEAIIVSEQGKSILYANHYAEQLFGYSKNELQGKPPEILTPERFHDTHTNQREQFLTNPKSTTYNERFKLYGLRKDNSEFPIKVTLGPINMDNKVLLVSLIQDITHQRELNDKFNLLSTLIDETNDSIEIVDSKTARFLDGNKAAWQELGYSREEFLSLTVQDIDPLVDMESFHKLIADLKIEKEKLIRSVHKRKDGSTFPVDINLRYVSLDRDYIITIARDVTELTKAHEIIENQAKYDSLTGLPNRNRLRDTIDKKMQSHQNQPFMMLTINIRHFKEVNHTVGHTYGDKLLKQFGPRLRKLLANPEDVFYMGVDEFAILLNGKQTQGTELAEKIIKSLEEPFIIGDIPIIVEVYIGIACYPTHGDNPEILIQKASIALDSAKKHDSVILYHPDYDVYNPEHLAIMNELRHALGNDELILYYQPKINLQKNQVIGLEALIRWQNPKRGFLLPNRFMDLAEKTALITPLTFLTLDLALQQGLKWQQKGIDVAISVNISPRNFLNKNFPDKLVEFLEDKVQGRIQFDFEITESTVMADLNHTVSAIEKIQALGASFSIDDFGKDYSSLNYLKQLTVNKLKIDKSFILNMHHNISNQVIVQFIINLAHKLGMEVVAEGVENAKTLYILKQLDCDSAQGFYIGKPMPASYFNDWLRDSPFHLKSNAK